MDLTTCFAYVGEIEILLASLASAVNILSARCAQLESKLKERQPSESPTRKLEKMKAERHMAHHAHWRARALAVQAYSAGEGADETPRRTKMRDTSKDEGAATCSLASATKCHGCKDRATLSEQFPKTPPSGSSPEGSPPGKQGSRGFYERCIERDLARRSILNEKRRQQEQLEIQACPFRVTPFAARPRPSATGAATRRRAGAAPSLTGLHADGGPSCSDPHSAGDSDRACDPGAEIANERSRTGAARMVGRGSAYKDGDVVQQEHSEEVLAVLKLLCLGGAEPGSGGLPPACSNHDDDDHNVTYMGGSKDPHLPVVREPEASLRRAEEAADGREAGDCEGGLCRRSSGAHPLGSGDDDVKQWLDHAERRREDLNRVLLLIQQLRANISPQAAPSSGASSTATATPLTSPWQPSLDRKERHEGCVEGSEGENADETPSHTMPLPSPIERKGEGHHGHETAGSGAVGKAGQFALVLTAPQGGGGSLQGQPLGDPEPAWGLAGSMGGGGCEQKAMSVSVARRLASDEASSFVSPASSGGDAGRGDGGGDNKWGVMEMEVAREGPEGCRPASPLVFSHNLQVRSSVAPRAPKA